MATMMKKKGAVVEWIGADSGMGMNVEVAEWSKAVDSGSIPKGRGFKSRPQHFLFFPFYYYYYEFW